jgi:hypothetical protein
LLSARFLTHNENEKGNIGHLASLPKALLGAMQLDGTLARVAAPLMAL